MALGLEVGSGVDVGSRVGVRIGLAGGKVFIGSGVGFLRIGGTVGVNLALSEFTLGVEVSSSRPGLGVDSGIQADVQSKPTMHSQTPLILKLFAIDIFQKSVGTDRLQKFCSVDGFMLRSGLLL